MCGLANGEATESSSDLEPLHCGSHPEGSEQMGRDQLPHSPEPVWTSDSN